MNKICPFCAEMILATAAKCRHCCSWMPDAHVTHASLLQQCPACASIVSRGASRCQYCQESLTATASHQLSLPIPTSLEPTFKTFSLQKRKDQPPLPISVSSEPDHATTTIPSTTVQNEEIIPSAQEEKVDVFIVSLEQDEKTAPPQELVVPEPLLSSPMATTDISSQPPSTPIPEGIVVQPEPTMPEKPTVIPTVEPEPIMKPVAEPVAEPVVAVHGVEQEANHETSSPAASTATVSTESRAIDSTPTETGDEKETPAVQSTERAEAELSREKTVPVADSSHAITTASAVGAISINQQLKKAFSPIPTGVNDTFAGVALAAIEEEAKEFPEKQNSLLLAQHNKPVPSSLIPVVEPPNTTDFSSHSPEQHGDEDEIEEPESTSESTGESLDADLLFEEIVQELQGDEFKMFEVLSTVRRKFWSPLRFTFQNLETRSLRKVLHSLNLSPIRLSIREMVQEIGNSLFQTYEQHVDEVAESLGLAQEQKQYLLLENKEKELLLGELRSPFREFVERLEALDEVCEVLKEKLESLPPSQRSKLLAPLLSSSTKRRLEQHGEARGIEASWRMLHAEIGKLATTQDVLQDEMKDFHEAMEQFLGQLEPTYGVVLNRILEIWSERLVATLREMSPR